MSKTRIVHKRPRSVAKRTSKKPPAEKPTNGDLDLAKPPATEVIEMARPKKATIKKVVAIREFLAKDMKPAEVVKAVKSKYGIVVSANYVSMTKTNMKKAGKGGKSKGKTGRPKGSKPTSKSFGSVGVIEAVAALVEATGSIQGAKDAIAAIERIGSF